MVICLYELKVSIKKKYEIFNSKFKIVNELQLKKYKNNIVILYKFYLSFFLGGKEL